MRKLTDSIVFLSRWTRIEIQSLPPVLEQAGSVIKQEMTS